MAQEPATRETLVDTLSQGTDSALRKYQELHVGDASILALCKYELLTFCFSGVPGALGFFLRKAFYKALFARLGRGTIIGPHVTLRCPRRITLGRNVFLDGNVVLDAKGSQSRIHLGDSVLIGKNTILSCASSEIVIGDDVSIGPHCYVRAGMGSVRIGSYVTIGSHTAVVSGNPSHTRLDIPMKKQVGSGAGVTIGDDVWVGIGAKLLDGVHVGDGSVVGAGAVVLKNIPDFAIAAGVPAKVMGTRKPERA